MEYLIRFVQVHESFRKPEVEALAALAKVDIEFLDYSECVCSSFLHRSTVTVSLFLLFGFVDRPVTLHFMSDSIIVSFLCAQTSK